MNKTELIHNGVSKKVYATDEADKVIIEYTDTITAYYKIKRAVIKDKGLYCNAISSEIFRILANAGVRCIHGKAFRYGAGMLQG